MAHQLPADPMSGAATTGRAASVRFILITLVIDALGFGLVVPIVPALVVKLSGLPVSGASVWVGWLLAAFAIMQFTCAPILGGLSDRFGRRPVLLLSLGGAVWACSIVEGRGSPCVVADTGDSGRALEQGTGCGSLGSAS